MVRPILENPYRTLIKLPLGGGGLFKKLQTVFLKTVLIREMKIRIITISLLDLIK